jgi:hypothetical protein
VGVIQRREQTRLALEAREPGSILRERPRQGLDRHLAAELRIRRAIDLAHAARADLGSDLVRTKPATRCKGHVGRTVCHYRELRREAG